ncbi:MAG: N-formylglutamate amidohydrolase [Rhodospirillaceae bacterium]|jgi:N-formylglutamate amidohydrolase|nr:N-formylglutamate amidohydrolase [Rhodospirillaceae bacterium]MBT5243449.1 N-formylglutamate amidohydrolase [Rhodospirillaceae bacterium]MBT5562037.1 N-formylglutamate amidohydrolase [Rhodospirillaceae bacterium]MBT6242210.1 N-formylglutamate amidohydrolase [Rhodospirillaceae bacterium]
MSGSPNNTPSSPLDILRPGKWSAPLVFASPHSGQDYSQAFIDASRLDPLALRRSEDAFVDEIFAAATAYGAPPLRARFPRVYVDPNREPFELDPAMFKDALPAHVNTTSSRVAAGLGTMARVVTSGEEVYNDKLHFDDAKSAIEATYIPYHEALKGLLEEARQQFGGCLLVDCHSMPSVGGPMDRDPGFRRVDFILGDRYGASCAPELTDLVEQTLQSMNYVVTRNNPYAGGFTTEHYGKPEAGCHTLQIEINRALYMNEMKISRSDGFEKLTEDINRLMEVLATIDPKTLVAT